MSHLETIYKHCINVSDKFEKKKILFIGSESYDGVTITLLDGLKSIGFDILTYKKNNINSWFCNTTIDELDNIENDVDFILSNLHWGTRWSLYNELKHNVPWVLVDGDDNNNYNHWKVKHSNYTKRYRTHEGDKLQERFDYRWMEKLNNYEPDVIFTTQKPLQNDTTFYLPFGINSFFTRMNDNVSFEDRKYDFTHIFGPGYFRREMAGAMRFIPGANFNNKIYGKTEYMSPIKELCLKDNNVHSYHRWEFNRNYYDVLNNSKCLIYPGIDSYPSWDSKRPWEALACGCMLLFRNPPMDITQYPLTDVNEFCCYNSLKELQAKCRKLLNDPLFFKENRDKCVSNGQKYFDSKALARYFLSKII